jgi:hypothetical protein
MATSSQFYLTSDTLIMPPKPLTSPVRYGVEMLERDLEKVLGKRSHSENIKTAKSLIVLKYAKPDEPLATKPEHFAIRFPDESSIPQLQIIGSDDLGIIYGLLYISHTYLGIDPFWFWTDHTSKVKDHVVIPKIEYISPTPRIRYRGWFVNDEVCLIGWSKSYPPPKEIWQPVFETLLRCGGNMVIPGTDLPRDGIHFQLASEMGLWITHHHAEPLGAEMFLRAYPDKIPSYDQNALLFEKIWREAIVKNKDHKVVWTLGFRGQGDTPFWADDPAYNTAKSRGELIGRVIARQYQILCEYVPRPICAVYLYGELTDLYRQGFLKFPEGVIKIWADNGYGKMVSRRQWNENPRVPSLPAPNEAGPHGLYYHVTFHDLQASSHLTLMTNPPELIARELLSAFEAKADEFLLVNCGNIRPHLYMLDVVAKLWNDGIIDIAQNDREFGKRFFASAPQVALACYRKYFETAIQYGPHEDDRAGEEFYHHSCREMITHWVKGLEEQPEPSLFWAAGQRPFAEQVLWFQRICNESLPHWESLRQECQQVLALLNSEDGVFFRDNLILAVELHNSGCRGLLAFCQSYLSYVKGDIARAFVYASEAMWNFDGGLQAMMEAEHDRWQHFYRADWLTNVRCTIDSLDSLRRYLRILGDGPLFFSWYKRYVIPESERRVLLENTQRRTLSNDELALLLQKNLPSGARKE